MTEGAGLRWRIFVCLEREPQDGGTRAPRTTFVWWRDLMVGTLGDGHEFERGYWDFVS
jgi:hypothetical protein